MVGSPFIYTECGKNRSLLNTTQIVGVTVEDLDLKSKRGKLFYSEYEAPDDRIYIIQVILVYGKPFNYLFATAADRDAMYDKFMAALAPAVSIIDTSPDVQRKKDEPPVEPTLPIEPPTPKPPRKPRTPRQ